MTSTLSLPRSPRIDRDVEPDAWTGLDRFLLGLRRDAADVPTRDDAQTVRHALAADGRRTSARLVAVSGTRGASDDGAVLFALALATASDDPVTRREALAVLPLVARTGADLLRFAAFVDGVRGWGRGLRRAVAAWYEAQPIEQLVLQVATSPRRDGWSHRDLLRLAHPDASDPARAALYAWICRDPGIGRRRPCN